MSRQPTIYAILTTAQQEHNILADFFSWVIIIQCSYVSQCFVNKLVCINWDFYDELCKFLWQKWWTYNNI